ALLRSKGVPPLSGGYATREANASGRDALTPKVRPNAARRSVTEQGRPALERWLCYPESKRIRAGRPDSENKACLA
ncbi:MAG: hypothetical protein ACLFUF_03240, partial [Opitutales bacterium]